MGDLLPHVKHGYKGIDDKERALEMYRTSGRRKGESREKMTKADRNKNAMYD